MSFISLIITGRNADTDRTWQHCLHRITHHLNGVLCLLSLIMKGGNLLMVY
jgi:hypothetical protein